MEVAVVTMPEGIVKGPETVLPRNSVFNWDRSSWVNGVYYAGRDYTDFRELICFDFIAQSNLCHQASLHGPV